MPTMLPAAKSWTIDESSSRIECAFDLQSSILKLARRGMKAPNFWKNKDYIEKNISREKSRK
jgi:hypothetical protein